MKKILLILSLALPACALYAQPELLEQKLATLDRDTARVNLSNKLANQYYNTAPEKTRRYTEAAANLADSLHYTRGVAEALANEALLYRLKGESTRELEVLLKALGLFEELHDSTSMARTLTDIGVSHQHQGDYNAARDNYARALSMQNVSRNKPAIAFTLRKIGILESELKNYPEALDAFNRALVLEKETHNDEGIANLLNNIGVVHYDMKDYNAALGYYVESMTLFLRTNNLNRLPAAYHNQSRVYLALGNIDKALQLAQTGLPIAQTTNNRMALIESMQLHTDIYAAKNDFKNAFAYQQKATALRDSVVNQRDNVHYAKLKALIETERKEQEINFLKKEQAWSVFRQKVSYAGLVLFVFIAGIVFYYQRKSIRSKKELLEKNAQIHQAQSALLKAELENKRLAERQLQHDLEFRHKELLTYTLNLAQKNTIMENLREGIHELMTNSDRDSKAKIGKLIKVIDYSLETEKDWDEFKMYFEKVHSSFFDNLRQQYPDLSQSDLKLCALISLNLSMKEMAELMGISPESVKMARHRLRKKLNLATEENLSDFVGTFKNS